MAAGIVRHRQASGHEPAGERPVADPTPRPGPEALGPRASRPHPYAANGLATLSDEQLAGMKEVWIVPHDYPKRPTDVANHRDGVVQYFPRATTHPQSDIDWALQHESAHNVWDRENAVHRERLLPRYAAREGAADGGVALKRVGGSPRPGRAAPGRMPIVSPVDGRAASGYRPGP